MNRRAAAMATVLLATTGLVVWALRPADPAVRATSDAATFPKTAASATGSSDAPPPDERPRPDSQRPPVSLALRALLSDGPIAALLEERVICARAGDPECMVDVAILVQSCEYHFYAVPDESAEALAEHLSKLQGRGIAPTIIEREKRTHARCAEITKAKLALLGPSSLWMQRAFEAGHPMAYTEAARALEFMAFVPPAQRQRFVLTREKYESAPRTVESSAVFLLDGDLSDASIARQAELHYAAALADGRPEVLMQIAYRFSVQNDPRLTSSERAIVGAAWVSLACARGMPCAGGSALVENYCGGGTCPPGSDLSTALAAQQGVGFKERVAECATRLDALLAASDHVGALKERCR